jgi:hypothetical protein
MLLRQLSMMDRSNVVVLATAVTIVTLVSCGGSGGLRDAATSDGGAQDAATSDGDAQDAATSDSGGGCGLDPVGTFTFRVHNRTATRVSWFFSCHRSLPLTLDTPHGVLHAGPGGATFCGYTCEQVYSGTVPGCSDCGRGAEGSAPPGGTGEIPWDRRVYVSHTIDSACARFPGEVCALGKAVAGVQAQRGTLQLCENTLAAGCNNPRYVLFTVDTTGSEATIEIGP